MAWTLTKPKRQKLQYGAKLQLTVVCNAYAVLYNKMIHNIQKFQACDKRLNL